LINVKPIGITVPLDLEIPDSQGIVSYCARVSNPSNQSQFDTAGKLLKYCVNNQHWSVFEMVNVVMEIECPRDIARQILRHRSFSFQEFSQRYAEATNFTIRECRLQDTRNRQNSIKLEPLVDVDGNVLESANEQLNDLAQWWKDSQEELLIQVDFFYKKALEKGIAKEVARVILPEGLTMSKMYMNGTLRSWLHYVDLREGNGTQLEHREVATKCREELMKLYPFLEEFYLEKNK
jgi:thymidylate synthase (FAD)